MQMQALQPEFPEQQNLNLAPQMVCHLKEAGLEAGEGNSNLEVQLLPRIYRQSFILVWLSKLVLQEHVNVLACLRNFPLHDFPCSCVNCWQQ